MFYICFCFFHRKSKHSPVICIQFTSSHRRCSIKRCSKKFCKIHRKIPVLNTWVKHLWKHLSFFLNRFTGLRHATLLINIPWYRCFPVNFAKFLRTPFLQNSFGSLLLHIHCPGKTCELILRGNFIVYFLNLAEISTNFISYEIYIIVRGIQAVRSAEPVSIFLNLNFIWISSARLEVLIKKKQLMFSCEFCEISKDTFFTEHLRWLFVRIQMAMIEIYVRANFFEKVSLRETEAFTWRYFTKKVFLKSSQNLQKETFFLLLIQYFDMYKLWKITFSAIVFFCLWDKTLPFIMSFY